jgi:hypothetical protein
MAAAVRAMRRAISPRLAIRRVLMGLTVVVVVVVVVLEVAGWVVVIGRRAPPPLRWRRGEVVGVARGARRRREVRLRERIVGGFGGFGYSELVQWLVREV